ncbi:MAG: hypothetical protein B7Z44_01360 [Caulobacter sp. 12-67-6]|mgnify:CR=1 FL=1|nr:MAG: hypothetical protein B7Z44_01360 [Caulobacter sp. 12-67-6]OYX70906.1 MAG: hypothetical protein B7Y81_10505 [Caulobacter sp. 32-67-35]
MEIEHDAEKRALTLEHRGLDFAQAGQVFEGLTLTLEDDRVDYGEPRYQTIGRLGRKTVMVVWTPRGSARRIISMRECNAREREAYKNAVG